MGKGIYIRSDKWRKNQSANYDRRRGADSMHEVARRYNEAHPWQFGLTEAEAIMGEIHGGVNLSRLTSSDAAK